MIDLETMLEKSSTDTELNRVKLAITRSDHDVAHEEYKQQFNGLSMKWGLRFNDVKIIVPNELREKLLNTLHYGHADSTKMPEAKTCWWPNITQDIEESVKKSVADLASSKDLKYQIPKNKSVKQETLTKPGQEIPFNLTT